MKTDAFTLLVCTGLLACRASAAAEPQQDVPTVRQYELQSIEGVSRAIGDRCVKSYPALKGQFDEAIGSFRLRVSAVMDALLATDRFRSLANVKVTKDLVDNAAGNMESIRNSTADVPETECKKAISDMAMSDEQVRDLLTHLLERRLSLPEMPRDTTGVTR